MILLQVPDIDNENACMILKTLLPAPFAVAFLFMIRNHSHIHSQHIQKYM